ncbi:MAG: TetR/AcrR family transcriptional regulator [Bacteroidales bacterium]|nr:TetR/AcrR family transcriptional regulator [Bacteroidales bacterium]
MKIDETKDIILDVATNIFSKFGFHKTTVDEIARAAHKAKGSVYYHFKSKEELFQGVIDKEFQILRGELIKAIDSGKNAKEKLTNYITVRMKTLNELINFYDALKNDYLNYLDFIEQIRQRYDNEETILIKSILTGGVNNDEFEINNVEITAPAILTALKGLEMPFFLENKYNELESRLNELISILIRGIMKR